MACWASLKPSIDESTPSAAMMHPPGTPGAATIVMASIQTNPRNIGVLKGIPSIIISATAQAVIFMQLPDIWIVAHNGTVNPAISSLTPILTHCRSVTGIVAADDWVPSAVK